MSEGHAVTETKTGEGTQPGADEPKADQEKKFSQAELDRIVGTRLAKEARKEAKKLLDEQLSPHLERFEASSLDELLDRMGELPDPSDKEKSEREQRRRDREFAKLQKQLDDTKSLLMTKEKAFREAWDSSLLQRLAAETKTPHPDLFVLAMEKRITDDHRDENGKLVEDDLRSLSKTLLDEMKVLAPPSGLPGAGSSVGDPGKTGSSAPNTSSAEGRMALLAANKHLLERG